MSFLNRDRLEKISISSKLMNNLVQQNFTVKPHRVIQDSWLTVEKQANGRFLKLTRSRKNSETGETVYERFHITDTSKNLFKWKPYEFSQPQNQWHKGYYSMEDMQPFLLESLRIERVRIAINPMECNGPSLTKSDMRALESIAHVAENRIMGIDMCATLTENAIAVATFNFNLIFSTQKLLGVRQLKMKDSYFEFMPESGYKCIYTNLDVLEIDSLNENNLERMLNLIENKAKYPDREMCFVCRTYDKNHVIKDFVKNICMKFCDSSVPYNYSLVIESSTVVLLDSEEEEELDLQNYQLDMDEFRLENGQTKEMLQLKKVSIEDVKENYNADFEPNTASSIFLLKRSRIEKEAPEK